MKKFLAVSILTLILFFRLPNIASAHCPLCVVGAGAGLSLSRFLGIDDAITGVWIAAFLGAFSLWMARLLKKKYLPLQEPLIYLGVFGLTLWSFYAFNLVDEHVGLIFGVPKLTFSLIGGGVVFYLVEKLSALVKEKRGKVLFPYQHIVFSLGSMLLLSIIIYILLNYYL